jgi:hypothetical protein
MSKRVIAVITSMSLNAPLITPSARQTDIYRDQSQKNGLTTIWLINIRLSRSDPSGNAIFTTVRLELWGIASKGETRLAVDKFELCTK